MSNTKYPKSLYESYTREERASPTVANTKLTGGSPTEETEKGEMILLVDWMTPTTEEPQQSIQFFFFRLA